MQPVLFDLPSAQREWFRTWNIDLLHAMDLNIIKRVLIWAGRLMGIQKCKGAYLLCCVFDTNLISEINKRLRDLPAISGVSHLNCGLYRFTKEKGWNKITVQPLVGAEYQSFLKVSKIIFRG